MKKGFSAGTLKTVAAALMTLDHIGLFLTLAGRPAAALRILGRAAAPVFLYLFVESLRHTRSRKRLLLRVYLAGVLHAAVAALLTEASGVTGWYGNILPTFFYTGLLAAAAEGVLHGRPAAAALLLLPAAGALLAGGPPWLSLLLPAPWKVEYSVFFVLLGLGWYALRGKEARLVLFALFCLLSAAVPAASPLAAALEAEAFFAPLQGWMILALPLLYAYNGRRGSPHQGWFYFYYPLHQYVLLLFFTKFT